MTTKRAFLLFLLCAAACAPANPSTVSEGAGFFTGFWHGLICTFALIGHIFDPSIGVYQTVNEGGWYDFGFLWGAAAFAGGGNRARRGRGV